MYTQIIAREIKPALGRHRADAIRRSDIKTLHTEIGKGAPKANRVLATAKAIWNFGKVEEIVTDNPAVGIKANAEQKRKRYLKDDELARLHAALDAHHDQRVADLFRLMLFTGARIGETLAAKWSDFDLASDDATWTKPGATTKTHTDHVLPLSKKTRTFLLRMRKARPDDVMPFAGLTYDAVRDDWKRLLKKAKIQNLRRHDLRHSFASAVLSSGKSLSDAGHLLGHTNPSTTSRYAHLTDERLRDASNAASDVLFPKREAV